MNGIRVLIEVETVMSGVWAYCAPLKQYTLAPFSNHQKQRFTPTYAQYLSFHLKILSRT